jgi:hypothetical protein
MATKKVMRRGARGEIPSFSNGAEFDALSPEEKERVWKSYNRKIPLSETRPLTAAERKSFEADRRRGPGRPVRGRGAKPVNVTIEKGLLERADRYAADQGITRAELVARALDRLLPKAKAVT